ncbi:hypothetical protein GH722_07335 [Alphaproteobacteria bacterium HT1-32]|nr:hypothetical protein [Alphaproteobacteria bacterium HT1-32]
MTDIEMPPTIKPEEETDLRSFWTYLSTPSGHEVAIRVVAIIEDLKRFGMERNAGHQKINIIGKYILVFTVIIAAVLLSFYDKFDSTIGVLFGTLIGYFFGRSKK